MHSTSGAAASSKRSESAHLEKGKVPSSLPSLGETSLPYELAWPAFFPLVCLFFSSRHHEPAQPPRKSLGRVLSSNPHTPPGKALWEPVEESLPDTKAQMRRCRLCGLWAGDMLLSCSFCFVTLAMCLGCGRHVKARSKTKCN